MPTTRVYRSFRYQVTIAGVSQMNAESGDTTASTKFSDGPEVVTASFSEVTGFDATYDVVEYRTGGDILITPEKYPGLIKYSNVTLSRGVSEDPGFFNWLAVGLTGQLNFSPTVTIHLLDDEGSAPVASWELIEAWPVKYTGPDLKANASEIAMEKLEIAHRGITRTL